MTRLSPNAKRATVLRWAADTVELLAVQREQDSSWYDRNGFRNVSPKAARFLADARRCAAFLRAEARGKR